MTTLKQWDDGGWLTNSTPNITGGISEDELCVMASCERSDVTGWTPSSSGGAGWTTQEDPIAVGDSTFNRGLGIGYKTANATEPNTHGSTWATNIADMLVLQDFGDGTFLEIIFATPGETTANLTSASLTSASQSGTVLAIAFYAIKMSGANPSGYSVSWGDDMATPDENDDVPAPGSNEMHLSWALKEISASGTITISADHSASSNDDNNGLQIGAILFQVSAAADVLMAQVMM